MATTRSPARTWKPPLGIVTPSSARTTAPMRMPSGMTTSCSGPLTSREPGSASASITSPKPSRSVCSAEIAPRRRWRRMVEIVTAFGLTTASMPSVGRSGS